MEELVSIADRKVRTAEHLSCVRAFTGEVRVRRDRGLPHPVMDFLFQYYPFPLSLLELWHPGIGFRVEWPAGEELRPPFSGRLYTWDAGVVFPDPEKLAEKEAGRLGWILGLLKSTRGRAPNFSCHGMHEWAMVYGGGAARHEKTLGLRLRQEEIDDFVRSRPIRCSHHDAFRFFVPAARDFNVLRPSLETRELFEQPGCLHANMDLYKWAAKCVPWVGSELLFATFVLAVELRDLDMRASPYDLTGWGRPPVKIETPEGRKEYEMLQRSLAEKARPLRDGLITVLECALGGRRVISRA